MDLASWLGVIGTVITVGGVVYSFAFSLGKLNNSVEKFNGLVERLENNLTKRIDKVDDESKVTHERFDEKIDSQNKELENHEVRITNLEKERG